MSKSIYAGPDYLFELVYVCVCVCAVNGRKSMCFKVEQSPRLHHLFVFLIVASFQTSESFLDTSIFMLTVFPVVKTARLIESF